MGNLLSAFWHVIVGSLFGGGGSGTVTRDELVTFTTDVSDCVDGIAFDLEQEHGAVVYSGQWATQVANGIENVELRLEQALSWIVFTILPNSLGKVIHDVYNGWIVPMTARLNHLDAEALDLYTRLGQLWTEVYNVLRPDVRGLLEFEDAFKSGDQPAINQLIAWLRDPVTLGKFVAPVVAQPLAEYLNTSPVEPLLRGYAYEFVNVWADEPSAIWDAVARWLVASD